MNELEEAEISMWRAWIEEKKEQQKGKPWPNWMFSKDRRQKKNEKNNTTDLPENEDSTLHT